MARISFDNGITYYGVDDMPEIIDAINSCCYWSVVEAFMDKDVCEVVHNELTPCTRGKFLHRYLELAKDDLIVG